MKLGLQQQEALDLILKFVKSKKLSFTLSGYAGTGKTFLTKLIIDELYKLNISGILKPSSSSA